MRTKHDIDAANYKHYVVDDRRRVRSQLSARIVDYFGAAAAAADAALAGQRRAETAAAGVVVKKRAQSPQAEQQQRENSDYFKCRECPDVHIKAMVPVGGGGSVKKRFNAKWLLAHINTT